MKTVWLVKDDSDFSEIKVIERTALESQLNEFAEVGYFDLPIPHREVLRLLGADNQVIEQYGEPYENNIIEAIGYVDTVAEYKNSVGGFTLNAEKYFTGVLEFIKKYNTDKYMLVIG